MQLQCILFFFLEFNKFDNMYCIPSNPSDCIDFGNMLLSDFENVKFKCSSMKTCKAFYESSQDGKKSYFSCKNTYDTKESSNNNISHILYIKGINNFLNIICYLTRNFQIFLLI